MNRDLLIALGVFAAFVFGLFASKVFLLNQQPVYGYGAGYAPGYGPGYGMMGQGAGVSGTMGPWMMGYGGSTGPGTMGERGMMAVYSLDARPTITEDEASRLLESYASGYGGVEVDDLMAFGDNYYARLLDAGGQGVEEVLVDRYTGLVYPEPGPNMMWNVRSGSKGEVRYDLAGATNIAEGFLEGYLPGAKVMEPQTFPGYYTFDFGREAVEGMFSVNAYSGDVWIHTWHGPYLGKGHS